jgi:hypothetical protein
VGEVGEEVVVSQEICSQDRFGNVSYKKSPTEISPQPKVQRHSTCPIRSYWRPVGCGKYVIRLLELARDELAREHTHVGPGIDQKSNSGGLVLYEETA